MRRILIPILLALVAASPALAADPNAALCFSTNDGVTPVDCHTNGLMDAAKQTQPVLAIPLSGAPVPALATSVGTTPVTLFSAIPAGVPRRHLSIANGNAAGGSTLFCTWDGSVPTKASFDFVVYAGGYSSFDAPGFVSSGAVNCIEPDASAASPVKAEQK